MKKTISILLALALLSSMAAGCGSKEEAAPQMETAPAVMQEATEAEETKASAKPQVPETKAPAAKEETVPLGKWIGYYIEDIQGLRVPMGEKQGMCLDILLEEGGKATIFYYFEESGEASVEATWSGNADDLQISAVSEDLPGSFSCKYIDGVLFIKAFPTVGSFLKMGLPGTPAAEKLQGGAESAAEFLEQVENGGSGHVH